MIIDRLYAAVEERGPVCVGLDPSPEVVPPGLLRRARSPAEAYLRFNREIVDATVDLVACYKVQIAHYEALGVEGLVCYRDTLRYIRSLGALVIGDVKRGDIGSTAERYAEAHFRGDFEADFITLNPYFGTDGLAPFFPHVEGREKGLFVLIRTSNPTAPELQDFPHSPPASPLYLRVAELVARWGERFVGHCGYSAIGGVVGGTVPEALSAVRERFPTLFLLVPGYGAQGARGRDVAVAFRDGNGAIVAASRYVIGAHRGRPDPEGRFPDRAREAVEEMREDILRWVRR